MTTFTTGWKGKGMHNIRRPARAERMMLTPEERVRWTPFLHDTFQAIAPDALPVITGQGRNRREQVIEMTLDANRMTTFSDITREEERVLCSLWGRRDAATIKWLHDTLDY